MEALNEAKKETPSIKSYLKVRLDLDDKHLLILA